MDNDANRSHTTVPPRPSQVPRPVRPTLGATEAAQTARQHMMAQHRSDYRRAAAPVQSAPPAGRAPAAPAKAAPVQPVAQVRTASQPQVPPQPAATPQPPVTKPVVPVTKASKAQPKPKPRPKAMPAAASGMQAPAAAQSLQPVQPHRVTYKKTPGMVPVYRLPSQPQLCQLASQLCRHRSIQALSRRHLRLTQSKSHAVSAGRLPSLQGLSLLYLSSRLSQYLCGIPVTYRRLMPRQTSVSA